ncbi:MAG: hypothetical protein HFH60_01555 [Lachnospiraceae bacterium]|nr:hypothetical protein [Lachnospiraceae bacterium]
MCEICRQAPCHPRCPNALEPSPLAYCSECGEGMFEGDKHFHGICKECLNEMGPAGVLRLFDESLEELEDENEWIDAC